MVGGWIDKLSTNHCPKKYQIKIQDLGLQEFGQ